MSVRAPITGTSGANAAQTVSLAGPAWLHYVTAKYSASPTQAGVTTTLNAAAGAAYDVQLNAGSANAQTTFYQPSAPLFIAAGDAIDVVAPAGGAGITSSVQIYWTPL